MAEKTRKSKSKQSNKHNCPVERPHKRKTATRHLIIYTYPRVGRQVVQAAVRRGIRQHHARQEASELR